MIKYIKEIKYFFFLSADLYESIQINSIFTMLVCIFMHDCMYKQCLKQIFRL